MKTLNASQTKILEFLRQRAQEGLPPSVREICTATGLKSTSTVHAHLKTLEELGLINRGAGLNRCIQIPGEKTVQVPLLGRVTAGVPILAIEEIENYVPFSANHISGKELFALKVVGDSMINAAIVDGDIIVVEKTPVANNGEIVVALIEDEATVKRFYREDGHFRLQPENDDYEPIILEKVAILGKVCACLRYY